MEFNGFGERTEWTANMPADKGAGNCVFCRPEENPVPVLWENEHRYAMYNLYPCGGPERGKRHLLLIPRTHIVYAHELTTQQVMAKAEAEARIFDYYANHQYVSYVKHTNEIKSMEHLHYHYIMGTLSDVAISKSVRERDARDAAIL